MNIVVLERVIKVCLLLSRGHSSFKDQIILFTQFHSKDVLKIKKFNKNRQCPMIIFKTNKCLIFESKKKKKESF